MLLPSEAGGIKAVVVGTQDHTEEAEDTDSLGEQPEFTRMEPPRMLVHNTGNTENRHITAENRCHVLGFHM